MKASVSKHVSTCIQNLGAHQATTSVRSKIFQILISWRPGKYFSIFIGMILVNRPGSAMVPMHGEAGSLGIIINSRDGQKSNGRFSCKF